MLLARRARRNLSVNGSTQTNYKNIYTVAFVQQKFRTDPLDCVGRMEAQVFKFFTPKEYSRNGASHAHDALRRGFADLGADFEEMDSTIYFALHREAMALGGDKAIENFKTIFKEVWQTNESADRVQALKDVYRQRGQYFERVFG
jgi:hypothetical protein